jgi:hypothetical protein
MTFWYYFSEMERLYQSFNGINVKISRLFLFSFLLMILKNRIISRNGSDNHVIAVKHVLKRCYFLFSSLDYFVLSNLSRGKKSNAIKNCFSAICEIFQSTSSSLSTLWIIKRREGNSQSVSLNWTELSADFVSFIAIFFKKSQKSILFFIWLSSNFSCLKKTCNSWSATPKRKSLKQPYIFLLTQN